MRPLLYATVSLSLLIASLVAYHVTKALMLPPGAGYWHTSGTQILDENGQPVRIAALTWYGMESSYWVPAGLDYQPYRRIMDEVKQLGFNTIRLPFSNELVETNPIVTQSVKANPELQGQHALTVLDDIVHYAHQIGLKIILDDHRSHASRPSTVNIMDEPLWYTAAYPESSWIHDWQRLARRYLGDDAVIGVDLRNEPHTGPPGPWNLHAYLTQGATWGPYRGVSNPKTDWRLAAERAGNAVLAINPHLLIIVEGLQLYPQAGTPGGVDTSWWAGILTPARHYPVRLRAPHQLVYSAHDWGPEKWQMPWFQHMSDASMWKAWEDRWAFLVAHPKEPYAAPLWLGEFGTCNNTPQCTSASAQQGAWFQSMLRFLRRHPAINWGFYALNGTNSNNCWASDGVLNAAWNKIADRELQAGLATIGAAPPNPPGKVLIPGTETNRKPRSPSSALCRLP